MVYLFHFFVFECVKAKRVSVEEALTHPYLDEGKLRFHSCMCRCCRTSSAGLRIYAADLEPCAEHPFDDRWEKKVVSMHLIKEELYRLVSDHAQNNRTPLCINPHSAAFKSFTR
jgi:nemo like kinase